jgi:hypothetical protein
MKTIAVIETDRSVKKKPSRAGAAHAMVFDL